MNNDILSIYKNRLINISSRNRSFVCNKLQQKKGVDLTQLNVLDGTFATTVVNYLLSPKTDPIVLLSDVTKIYNQKRNEILKTTSKDSVEQQTQLEELKLLLEALMTYEHKLKVLAKELQNVHKETGRHELFVGYPFMEGKLKDGVFFRAPLFLFPVSITYERSTHYLKKTTDPILFNKVFLLAAAQHNELEVKGWNTEYNELTLEQLNETLARLDEIGLLVPDEVKIQPVPFQEYTTKTLPNYHEGYNRLVQQLVIGQFPIANTIYNDYETLIESEASSELINNLIDSDCETILTSYEEPQETHGKLSFNEETLYAISDLDFSQELAVNRVEQSNQLVIYGPPGTGKSQTLTNIVANTLAKGKRVLVVSQKRAALDVIYNRLGVLNEKAILIYDATKDKKSFYEMVSANIEMAEHESGSVELESLKQISKEIDDQLGQLEELAQVLHRQTTYGLSLQEMYSKSQAIENRQNSRFESFMLFKQQQDLFNDCSYDQLSREVEALTDEVLKSYQTVYFEKIKHPHLNQINPHLTKLELEERLFHLTRLSTHIQNLWSHMEKEPLLYPLITSHFTTLDQLSEDRKEEIATQLTLQLNEDLTESFVFPRWRETKYLPLLNLSPSEEALIQSNFDVKYFHPDLSRYQPEVQLKALEVLRNQINHYQTSVTSTSYVSAIFSALTQKQTTNDSTEIIRLTSDELVEIAKQLNAIENGELMVSVDTKHWWSISYWKNRPALKEQDAQNRQLYEEKQAIILKQLHHISGQVNELLDKMVPLLAHTFATTPFEWLESMASTQTVSFVLERLQDEMTFNQILLKAKQKESDNRHQYEQELEKWRTTTETAFHLIHEIATQLEISRDAFITMITTDTSRFMLDLWQQKEVLVQLQEDIHLYELFVHYYEDIQRVEKVSELGKAILKYALDEDMNQMKYRVTHFVEFNTLIHIAKLEEDLSVRDSLQRSETFNTTTHQIEELMKRKQVMVQKFLKVTWSHQFVESIQDRTREYKEFKRQAQKKRQLLPIRQYMETYSDFIFNLYPCVLSSPEMVSQILPLTKGLFDLVIFDEASQMFIEKAIPSIYRANRVVIAGDDKQLKPSHLFQFTLNEELGTETELDTDMTAALEEVSLLDLAKVNYDSVTLNYHYRSRFVELINFSNYAFYGGRLKISPNLTEYDVSNPPIECRHVDGHWIDRKNMEEAKEVVELVAQIMHKRQSNETIGIITFNTTQRDLIEDMLERKAQQDKVFQSQYIQEINRVKNNEDVSLFVKNIENVQGDERDIIIFSVGYAPNEKGRVSTNFGSLSQDGGENRLNVAISRAKQKIYVVTSISPAELNVENSQHRGPRLFKKYLQYCEEISKGNKEEAQVILNTVLDSQVKPNEERQHDSDFEAEVYDALVEAGYDVKTQVGVSGYRIDLAIYDRKTSRYVLGIECDGALYHSSKSARERDIHRQRYLESRGWKIIRIWSRHWWKNPKAEIERIKQACPLNE